MMRQDIDVEAVKRDHPIDEVVTRYGVALRQSGRALVGRCPFHLDGGRPNLYVYPDSHSYFCYRCSAGGDVITFIERLEQIGFREALDRLTLGQLTSVRRLPVHPRKLYPPLGSRQLPLGSIERASLAAAVELYHNQLLANTAALGYILRRGVGRQVVEECRLGYAEGDTLLAYLRWRRLPIAAATRAGLLLKGGAERMIGRIVIPEIRQGQPVWMIGRLLQDALDVPKYLGLPGSKPLIGWDSASHCACVVLVEGGFDWLTLRSWGVPALAIAGTHLAPRALAALTRFDPVFLALDADDAGREASAELLRVLGRRARHIELGGFKDVSEMGISPAGRERFLSWLGTVQARAA